MFQCLASAQTGHALTPWVNGAPDITINLAGAIAVTNAYTQVVNTILAAPSSVDTFNDVDPVTAAKGSRWTVHYFTGNASLGAGLAGKKILLARRTVGGTGYGVIPQIANIPLEFMDILGLPQTA